MRFNLAAAAAASLAATASAQIVSYPAENDIIYSLSVPQQTSNTGSGPIFFQLSGPASMQWIALGFGGPSMVGTNIFVMYPDGQGNVTVSPRSGIAHVMPMFNPDVQMEVLAGSGIVNGKMVANVRCDNCETWQQTNTLSFGSMQQMVHAYRMGEPAINSPDESAIIRQHNQDGEPFQFDLSKAVTQSTTNPFLADSPAMGGATAGGSQAQETSEEMYIPYWKAHGTIMGLVMVVLFPLGALIMRVFSFKGLWAVHAGLQAFSLLLLTAGFGIGVWLADQLGLKYTGMGKTHTIFGTCIFAFFWIQPFGGLIAHYMFTKQQSRTIFGHVHAWFGRAIIILGIVNGGLGLKLADNTTGGKIAYGVIAGIMGLVYITIVAFVEIRKLTGSKKSTDRELAKGDMSQTS